MPEPVERLFDEYAAAFARGERPQALEYLQRAGEGADVLARLLEGFVRASPAPQPDDDTVTVMGAWLAGHPPLVELRAGRGIRLDEVVEALMGGLGLDPGKRGKVKRYYQRLEGGLLEPGGVSARVWGALSDLLPGAAEAAAWRPRPALEPAAYLRPSAEAMAPMPAPPPQAPSAERDEIDDLFLSGCAP